MKKFLLLSILFAVTTKTFSQRLLSWTPEFPNDNSNLTFTIDCTKGNQGLLNFEGGNSSNIFMHVGVITNLSTGPSDWRYVKFAWGTTPALANATPLGGNKYSYNIPNVRTFFAVPAGETILKVTAIFRNSTGALKQVNSDNSDMYLPIYPAGQFAVRLNLPPFEPRFIPYAEPINIALGGSVNITGVASNNAALTLKLNGNSINTAASATTISANPTIATACEQKIMFEGNDGSGLKKDSFSFYINPTQTIAALPTGAIEGINYLPGNTSATLVLYAPNKTSVNVIGDFNNWTPSCAGQMNKTPDGNYYWITITGLTPGVEYGYQYLVDNTIRIADPYTQKILDPDNDQFITSVTYPNLKPYPTGLTSGLVGILQTAEPQYTWLANSFVKPDKRNLMAYELLIRDFTAEHSYQSLIDSLNYLKNIGINAIELMPINEFDGNESWGYNPSYFFAPDKYYGPKNKLKEFIDKCHLNGIAVILDVVYNHCTGNAAQAKLYWNSATNQPAANNPWLNVVATHPYSVFNDFNHNSAATKYFVQRNLNFWLDEYRVDGFRFDLAKGFSQTITNTTTVENYDPARVANLNYYYDNVVPAHPNTYMILEFLGSLPNQEEQEYVTKGFMPWGNMNARYNQCTMGFASNSDISPIVYNSSQRNFSAPSLMGYMESHDEERTMYKNLQFGNSSGGYDARVLATALAREEAAASVFFTVPGPKMIWQFEERGYDVSLVFGGSNLAPKPPRWEYMLDPNRRRLYDAYKKMLDLRLNNPAVFNNTTFTYDFFNGGGLVKTFQIADPNAAGKKVTVVANLDVVQQTKSVTFQATGDWINYISNGPGIGINGATNSTFNLTNATQSIALAPGEYHIYVSVPACATIAPTGTTTVTYCQNATATTLTATGTSLLWYTTATGGTGSTTAPIPSTATVGNTIYYVSQTLNGCEGPRLAITVTVNALPAAPTVTSPLNYCQNYPTLPLAAIGTNLLWYTTVTGGTGSTLTPTPNSSNVSSTIYYVSQTVNGCEGPRAQILVNIVLTPPAPTIITPITYCQNVNATALTATAQSGASLLWYTASVGGVGSNTAPVPSTATTGNTIYYVSQITSLGCESPRAAITVTVNPAPTAPIVTTPITYCQNATSIPLATTGTNLKWYTTATGGVGNTVAPVPSTTTIGSTIYYVSQTVGTCESPRAAITVTITATTPAPIVITPVTYCQNAIAATLTATGTNLLWYTSASGGTGSAIAPTPTTAVVGSTIYYVSQTQTCGESSRAAITVTVNAIPNLPTVTSPITYCQNTTAVPLTATGTNLLWYTALTGGTGSTTAPTPSTTTVGTVTYYVSQTVNGCEGSRQAIFVVINAIPAAPLVTTPVTYCQNVPATTLTATGTNLKWYTTATGGTGSTTAPTPITTTVGSTIYYVSQTINNCESPRALITVNVVASTPAPTVTTPVTYCRNATAIALTATGTNLLWYITATGGTGSAIAPIPSTTAVGSTIYYVSQTLSCGEGPRAAITVTVNAVPAAPIVTSPIALCQNIAATALTATGTSLLWYTAPIGGTGSAIAPTPSTTAVGSVTYYVSQTSTGCEGPFAAIVVNINSTPGVPTAISPISYCQNATATALTATGTNLLWYTVATGGTGVATAPIPSTTTAGSTNYYVSLTLGTCEGPRANIIVNVTALPTVATVVTPVTYCQNATATALTATGTNLLWFTTATGGTGSATAPTPSTTIAGSTTYYVAQTNSCGEGSRAAIVVNVNATPAAPTALTTTNVTLNSATLNWTGAENNFYTVEYKLTTTATWTTVATGIQATTYNLTGLTIGSVYQWRVSANCAATGLGNFATAPLFNTASRNNLIPVVKDGIGLKISPNPVRTNAIIDYIVPATGEVTFTIIDQYGKIVKTFSEGQKLAGQYQKDIVGEFSAIAKGSYFIKLQQNGKKIALHFVKY
jgi:glycosidase/nitrous oxide reductase accessory protein NosL